MLSVQRQATGETAVNKKCSFDGRDVEHDLDHTKATSQLRVVFHVPMSEGSLCAAGGQEGA